MWMLFPAAALADRAAEAPVDTTCQPASLEATMPADGDVGVSPDAVIALVFEDRGCGGGFFDGALTGEGGPIPFALEQEGILVRLVPEAPFSVGETIHLEGVTDGGPLALTFTVGEEGLGMSGEPTAVEVTAVSHCDGLAFTTLEGTVRFDAPAAGLLQTAVVSDQLSAGWVTAGVVDGRAALGFTAEVLGAGQEHCVDARLLDEAGAVVWQVEGDCARADVCPPQDGDDRAVGCSTAGAPRGAGLLALAAILGARRRRR